MHQQHRSNHDRSDHDILHHNNDSSRIGNNNHGSDDYRGRGAGADSHPIPWIRRHPR